MTISLRLLLDSRPANLERLARWLRVPLPSPMLSAYARHRAIACAVHDAIRSGTSAAVGAASVVVAALALGVL